MVAPILIREHPFAFGVPSLAHLLQVSFEFIEEVNVARFRCASRTTTPFRAALTTSREVEFPLVPPHIGPSLPERFLFPCAGQRKQPQIVTKILPRRLQFLEIPTQACLWRTFPLQQTHFRDRQETAR